MNVISQTAVGRCLAASVAGMVLAALCGCTGSMTRLSQEPSDPVVDETAAKPEGERPQTPFVPDKGPTALETIAKLSRQVETEQRRTASLQKALDTRANRIVQLERQLADQSAAADRLKRQLADMDRMIEDVRARTSQVQTLRMKNAELREQLETANLALEVRKNELYELTLKLEDIYQVLIKQFKARRNTHVATNSKTSTRQP